MTDSAFVIAGRTFRSRLIVGTGKYSSHAVMAQAHEASGADMVTVAVRRVNISDRSRESLLDYIDTNRMFILPNTAGCYTADEAIRTARLGREAGLSNWVKLEVIGDERTLFPDNEALIEATRVLVKEGFVVLPYTNDDPIACRKLEDAGAAAVMPLGAPIGSGLGIQNVNNMRIIREFARVPLIVDAGVGTASDAALAMELGADGVLMNTAIAGAEQPVAMARGDEARGHRRPAGVSRGTDSAGRCTRRPAVLSKAWSAASRGAHDATPTVQGAQATQLIEQLNTPLACRAGRAALRRRSRSASLTSLRRTPPACSVRRKRSTPRRRSIHQRDRITSARARIDEYKIGSRRCCNGYREALAARERRMEALMAAMRSEHAELRTSLGVLQQATHNLAKDVPASHGRRVVVAGLPDRRGTPGRRDRRARLSALER